MANTLNLFRGDAGGLPGDIDLTISADRHVVPVRIPERELPCLSVRVHVGLLFEPGDESAGSLQCNVEIVDAEEQEETVTRRPLVRTQ